MAETTYLEYHSNRSNKFYEVTLDGATLTVRSGRIGRKGKKREQTFDSPAAAEAAAQLKIRTKLRRRYLFTDDVTPADAPGVKPFEPLSRDTLRWGRAYSVDDLDDELTKASYEVLRRATLQMTDLGANANKFYSAELQRGAGLFRVYTHWGRTDDLTIDPEAGDHQVRYYTSRDDAEADFDRLMTEKRSQRKGYHQVHLAMSRVGSSLLRGQHSGTLDVATLARLEAERDDDDVALSPAVASLVGYLYDEASAALTQAADVRLTAQGLETPLGLLTVGQIDQGEALLKHLRDLYLVGAPRDAFLDVSNAFYSKIPHRIGRSQDERDAALIDTLAEIDRKQETLQLMRDMLRVYGHDSRTLVDDDAGRLYRAMGCHIEPVDRGSYEFDQLRRHVVRSQVKTDSLRVLNLYRLRRDEEHARFDRTLGNEQLLFHGSRARNWFGILSRGIQLPRVVVSMGVNRTDFGWLGHGIYFGSNACTALFYTTPGRRRTRFMAVSRVALGVGKTYRDITWGLEAPPRGYDSCLGVPGDRWRWSDFSDAEFVVYRAAQQRLEYLVEFTL